MGLIVFTALFLPVYIRLPQEIAAIRVLNARIRYCDWLRGNLDDWLKENPNG